MLLDATIKEDPEILEVMANYLDEMTEYKEKIAETEVYLQRNGTSQESNLGDLVTDALRTCYWKDTTMAVQNNGGIRFDFYFGSLLKSSKLGKSVIICDLFGCQ